MDQQRSNVATGGQLTCSTLSLMVPTLRLMSAFAWQVVQHCNVVHYGKVEELVQLVTEVVPSLLSDTEKVHLLLGLRATEEFPEADLLALVWEFISRLDKLLPLPDIKQTAELLSTAPSLLEECGQLEFEADQLKTLLDHHTQQRNAKECSWVQSQGTIPSTASSRQSKPQQNCSIRKRWRRSSRKLSPHWTEEDKDIQSDHSLEEEEGVEGKQSDEEWLPEDCSKVIIQSDDEWLPVNDHIIEEEEGAEGKQSNEEWVHEDCSKTKRRNESTDLKKRRPNISSSVSGSGSKRKKKEDALCELVRNYVHLYDVTSPLYSRKDVRQNSWDEISSTLKLSAKECRDKWKVIRDRFVKAHNKVLEKRSRGDLSLMQRLKWLKTYISHRSAVTNDPNNDDMEQHLSPSVSSLPVLAEHSQHHEGSLVQSQGTIPSTASSPQSKPQQNCSNRKRCGRSWRKLSAHRTDEEWLPEDCSKTKRRRNESTDLKKWRPNILSSVTCSGSKRNNPRRFEDTLCELVRKHAHLYDVTSPLYSYKDVRQNSWDEISSTLELSAKKCRDKWKVIRDSFVKAHNKVLEKRSSGDLSIIQRLEWLKSYIKFSHRPAVTNDPNNDDMEQNLSPSVSSLPVQAGHSQHHEGIDLYTEPGLHACPQRSSSHSQEDVVLQHIRQEHTAKHDNLPHSDNTAMKSNERPIHKCSYCGLEFTQCYLLKRHMGIHTMPFHCDHCEKRYASKKGLIAHQRLHTGERPFTCSYCGRGFMQMAHLKEHMRTHTGEHRYTCHICGKKSIQQHTHIRHMLMHKGEKNYLCTECGKAFLTNGDLWKHTKWHTGERPHMCKLCGKRFVSSSELTVHMRIHTGEKPYSCTHCPKAFRSANRLKRHKFIHSDKKPYECSKCGKGFTQSFNRTVHMRTCKKDIPV